MAENNGGTEVKKEKPSPGMHPYDEASWISRLSVWWVEGYMKKGFRYKLDIDDFNIVSKEDQTDNLGNRLWNEYENSCSKATYPLLVAIWRMFKWKIIILGFVCFIAEVPLAIHYFWLCGVIADGFDANGIVNGFGWEIYGILMFYNIAYDFLLFNYCFHCQRLGMQIRIACSYLIYKKALRLHQEAFKKTTCGQMVNILTNDLYRFDMVYYVQYVWVGVLFGVAALLTLGVMMGVSTLAGTAVVVAILIIQFSLKRFFQILRKRITVTTDQRIMVVSEIVSSMRVLKLFAWENVFSEILYGIRRKEIYYIRWSAACRAINGVLSLTTSTIFPFVCFYASLGMGVVPSLGAVFVCYNIGTYIPYTLNAMQSLGVTYGSEILVAVRRLQDFLALSEVQEKPAYFQTDDLRGSDKRQQPPVPIFPVVCYGVFSDWEQEQFRDNNLNVQDVEKQLLIRQLSMQMEVGQLVCITGGRGTGKTSLLMLLLGELSPVYGRLEVTGSAAYVEQLPWITAGTVRENVLFGRPFDLSRYREVVRVCALDKDFELLVNGDMTYIGDKGCTLSGGQKGRISMARAAYYDADIYFLDNFLKSLDSRTRHHLFHECILKYLKNKTRILVTEHLEFVQNADGVISTEDIEKGIQEPTKGVITFDYSLQQDETETKRLAIRNRQLHAASEDDVINSPEAEAKTEGSVGLKLYYKYFMAGGAFMFILSLVNIIGQKVFMNLSSILMSNWMDAEGVVIEINKKTGVGTTALHSSDPAVLLLPSAVNATNNITSALYNVTVDSGLQDALAEARHKLDLYTLWVCLTVATGITSAFFFYYLTTRASIELHTRMFRSIVRAKQSFFDENSCGRILNRFSQDVGIMDNFLADALFLAIMDLLLAAGYMAVAIQLQPWTAVPTVFTLIALKIVMFYQLRTYRDLKRWEAMRRSPIYSHLSTTLNGLPTIRAFREQQLMKHKFVQLQNRHNAIWLTFLGARQYVSQRMDWTNCFYAFVVGLVILLYTDSHMTAGDKSLIFAQVFSVCNSYRVAFGVAAEAENMMTSVERILHYCDLESEAAFESTPDTKPPPDWPAQGGIEFKNVSMSYSSTSAVVLKGLSFKIEPKSKVAIMGRTGAGKSSILNALTRLTEPEGVIEIDGINVLNIGLHDLRKTISVLHQVPMLFSGTIRHNLDPTGSYSDEELWSALSMVHMREYFESGGQGLDMEIATEGLVLSMGEQQLFCLARAVLQRNRILFLDEISSDLDEESEKKLFSAILTYFKDTTVLSITHKLPPIHFYDVILTLQEGRLHNNEKCTERLSVSEVIEETVESVRL